MYKLTELAYTFNDLEPYMDAPTLMLHYVDNQGDADRLQKVLKEINVQGPVVLEQILRHISQYDEVVRHYGGAYFNHSLFWAILSPAARRRPEGELNEMIQRYFGGLEALKELMTQQAEQWFGSGWLWLLVRYNGTLAVSTTANNDNPLMDVNLFSQGYPILGIDLWEHAYYLQYKDRKQDYLKACWEILDWSKVESKYEQGKTKLSEWSRIY